MHDRSVGQSVSRLMLIDDPLSAEYLPCVPSSACMIPIAYAYSLARLWDTHGVFLLFFSVA